MSNVNFPLVRTAAVVGISGSRSPSSQSLEALAAVLSRLSPRSQVVVGCARGIDATVRSAVATGRLRVYQASSFGAGRWTYAARSASCVRAVARAIPSCLWLSFPATACPAGLVPSASASSCFSGYGSGTWASLAYAMGLGIPCMVFLPAGFSAPAGWSLVPVSGANHWYLFTPATVQVTLF